MRRRLRRDRRHVRLYADWFHSQGAACGPRLRHLGRPMVKRGPLAAVLRDATTAGIELPAIAEAESQAGPGAAAVWLTAAADATSCG